MLQNYQRVQKEVFFQMTMGSISPRPQKVLFLFLFFKKSCDFIEMFETSSKGMGEEQIKQGMIIKYLPQI